MARKFKFLGYGDREIFKGRDYAEYQELPKDTYVYFGIGDFTVGNLYEMVDGTMSNYCNDRYEEDARFVDNDGVEAYEDLRFFEEVVSDEKSN